MNSNWSVGKTWWLMHCNCYFGFDAPAKFVEHKDGGFFVSQDTGEHVTATIYQGLRRPKMQ